MPVPSQTLGSRVVVSADPAAGAEIAFTADKDMIVHSLTIPLVTSAAVANRRVHLVADDGTNVFFRQFSTANQTASTSFTYAGHAGPVSATAGDNGVVEIPIPPGGLRLRKGDRLRTITSLLDAADNYGAMVLQAEYLS